MNYRHLLLVLFTILALPLTSVRADEFAELKQSAQLRAPAIEELKQQGVLHEGPGGTLVPNSDTITPEQRNLLNLENFERAKLFQLIAVRTGKSVDEIKTTFERMSGASSSPSARTQPPSPAPVNLPPITVPAPITGTQPPSPAPVNLPPITVPAPTTGTQPSSPAPVNLPPITVPATTTATTAGPMRPLTKSANGVLPLKVLTRPLSNIYSEPQENGTIIRENVPGFSAFYVYEKTETWYRIGSDKSGKKLGWMRAQDVIEWKQNLVVEFTHPGGRQPVLMFKEKAPLSQLVSAQKSTRAGQVDKLRAAIKIGDIGDDFPVRTIEPARAVQSRDQFYLLPIINADPIEIDGREGRILQLAAATKQRGAVEIINPKQRNDLTHPSDFSKARGAKVDIVFVMDLTRSMGPFADRTVEMINKCVARIGADQQVAKAIRFGFWGYRDFPELCKGIEYNTRNYTPELQSLSDFARTLREVHETKVDSIDYNEDVFAGVSDAIGKTHWRDRALRILVLVGDAPGRGPKETDPECTSPNRPVGTRTGMNTESIRSLANDANIYLTALYLKAPKWAHYADLGERQFRSLSRNRNDQPGHESFLMINASDTAVYGAAAESLADTIVDAVQGRAPSSDDVPSTAPSGVVDTVDAARAAGRDLARNMFRGAMVDWLGKEDAATVPRDVTVWAVDKDLADPTIQSLDVQVFLTKGELNSLKITVDSILNAGTRGQITSEDFFKALSAVATLAAADPSQVRNATTLAQTGLIPDYLQGLPYRSQIMDMTNDSWRAMSPDAQDQFLRTIDSKLRFYQAIHDNAQKWQSLNDGDDRDNWVAGVPLDQLP